MAMIRSPILRGLVFAAGMLCTGLALIGVVIRGLPTTPFLLLAAGCFSNSSVRMNRWIHGHPQLGPFLRDLREGRGMTLRIKVMSLAMAWALLGGFALFLTSSIHLRIFLIALASTKTVLLAFVIPTKRTVTGEGESEARRADAPLVTPDPPCGRHRVLRPLLLQLMANPVPRRAESRSDRVVMAKRVGDELGQCFRDQPREGDLSKVDD